MRAFVIGLILSIAATSAFGYTFVLKSGNRIEGILLYEEDMTIRIEDHTGVRMTLKKSNLDFPAMKELNRIRQAAKQTERKEPVAPLPPRQDTRSQKRMASSKQFEPVILESEAYWKKQIASASRSLVRLKSACRNAGSSSSYGKVLRTETYWIDGKPVKVTGYWAHPANVENAKRICNEAIRAQATLEVARQKLNESQRRRSYAAPGGNR